jgi:AP-5 complex subunit beta-1
MDRPGGGLQLSLLDWELIFTDFKSQNRSKWLSQYSGLAILEQALYIIAKKDYPSKLQLLEFIEENIEILIGEDDTEEGLGSVVEALRTMLDSSSDGSNSSFSLLKEQMMITATVALITLDSLHRALRELQMLVEILLGVINRPNYGLDRQARGTACECLRELEKSYPCLLHTCAGHINFLFSSERTHVAQSYTLLLSTVLQNLALYMYTALPGSQSGGPSSFLSTSTPLIPFTVPSFLVSSEPGKEALSIPKRELLPTILKEFKRVVGSLLDRPNLLTSCGMLEFVSSLIDIAAELELQGSILKVQLYNLMYTYSPLLCHVVLMIYFHFIDSFEGEEEAIFRRFILLCNDPQQPLVIRILGVHWLLGLDTLLLKKDKRSRLASMANSLYPLIYDPLSLKALKLDSLAHCSGCLQFANVFSEKKPSNSLTDPSLEKEAAASKLFKDGTVCLSAFRWLPSWSSETRLMFRMFHRFLTVDRMHLFSETSSNHENFNSTLFKTLEVIRSLHRCPFFAVNMFFIIIIR